MQTGCWQFVASRALLPIAKKHGKSTALGPLAAAKIDVLAVVTFDTDYVFVKAALLDGAIHVLGSDGLKIKY